MHRDMGNPGLAESLLPEELGQNRRLERISEMVDWERFEGLVSEVYSAREGRPSYPPLTMGDLCITQTHFLEKATLSVIPVKTGI